MTRRPAALIGPTGQGKTSLSYDGLVAGTSIRSGSGSVAHDIASTGTPFGIRSDGDLLVPTGYSFNNTITDDTMRDLKRMDKTGAGLSDSGMSSRKRRLIAEMKEVLGPDCLADAGREPAWRSDVAAQREKDACRHESSAVA